VVYRTCDGGGGEAEAWGKIVFMLATTPLLAVHYAPPLVRPGERGPVRTVRL
jgi:hypothetical protein